MKNKTVKACLLIAIVTLLCSVLFVSASAETTADGFTYTILHDEVTITGYEGTSTDLIIPSTVEGYPVAAIGDSAFSDRSDFTGKLVIPEGVVSIGSYAFFNCTGLTGDLIIPEGVAIIGEMAFYGCKKLLSGSVSLPQSIEIIDMTAFFTISNTLSGKLNHVAYCGTAEQWAMIDIKNANIFGGCNLLEDAKYFHTNYNPEKDITENVTSGTCVEKGYKTTVCSCGYVYSKESTDFGEEHLWIYTLDDTCESGMYLHHCARGCGAEKYEYIEGSGHNYQFVPVKKATCTEDGIMHQVCSRCEATGETVVDVGSKLGHDLTETTVLSQQSCTQDGISVQACKRCAEIVATIEGAYGHYDNDGDGKCDECKVVLEVILPEVPTEPETDVTPEEPEEPESPEEPQESTDILSKLIELFNKILNILKKLFGM